MCACMQLCMSLLFCEAPHHRVTVERGAGRTGLAARQPSFVEEGMHAIQLLVVWIALKQSVLAKQVVRHLLRRRLPRLQFFC